MCGYARGGHNINFRRANAREATLLYFTHFLADNIPITVCLLRFFENIPLKGSLYSPICGIKQSRETEASTDT